MSISEEHIFNVVSGQTSPNWNDARILSALRADVAIGKNPMSLTAATISVNDRLCRRAEDGQLLLSYVGHRNLLLAPQKVSLICHRADEAFFEQQAAACLQAARGGAVVVSAFISPRERDIKQLLLEEKLPIIEIRDNGFSPMYKPTGLAFYACAEERLLQISCWSYLYQKDSRLTRAQCLTMNELARLISKQPDDWWKK